MIHVMVDIETLGTSNKSVLLSIGAVKFDADNVLDKFEVGVDPADCQRHGLAIDAGTVLWWLDPERADARQQLLDLPRVDLHSALSGFADWCATNPNIETPPPAPYELGSLWGNGSTFDNVNLRSACGAVGVELPFGFRQDACYRTLKNLAPDVEFTRVGTFHKAVDDALSQAVHLQMICRQYGIQL